MRSRFLVAATLGSLALLSATAAPVSAADTEQNFTSVFHPPADPPRLRLDQFGSDPGPSIDPGGWDGNFCRLTEAVNSQSNSLSFNQAIDMTGNTYAAAAFEFRIDNGPGGADGFGVALLDTAIHGADATNPAPGFSEEPNLAGSLGVGFDTFNNAGTDEPDLNASEPNSVSLHYDGQLLEHVSIADTDIPLFETADPATVFVANIFVQFGDGDPLVTVNIVGGGSAIAPILDVPVPGLTPYEFRLAFHGRTGGANANQDLDNILAGVGNELPIAATLVETFEDPVDITPATPPTLVGGTPFSLVQLSSGPGPSIQPNTPFVPTEPTEADAFLRAAPEVGSQSNLCVFDKTSDDTAIIEARFQYRGLDGGAAGRADGGSFLLFDTTMWGDTGGDQFMDFVPWEEPNLAGTIGVGFDTFSNDTTGDTEGVANPEPNVGNHVSLNWNGSVIVAQRFDRETEIDLVNGVFNECFVRFVQTDGGTEVAFRIVDGTDGSVHGLSGLVPDLQIMNPVRVGVAARTGGAADNYDFDNIRVRFGADASSLTPISSGDCDGNGRNTIADVTCMVANLFPGFLLLSDALAPCESTDGTTQVLDVNRDGGFNIVDVVGLATHLFGDGPGPIAECVPLPGDGCRATCE